MLCILSEHKGIGIALYGLQGMSSDEKEVRNLLGVLVPILSSSDAVLSSQKIGNALYGLQSMSSDVQEVKDVLNALTQKISSTLTELDSQGISNALYGLQGMSSDAEEVRDFVDVFAERINSSKFLYDIQRMYDSPCMLTSIERDWHHTQNPKGRESGNLKSLQRIGNAIFGLRNIDLSNEWATVIPRKAVAKRRDSSLRRH